MSGELARMSVSVLVSWNAALTGLYDRCFIEISISHGINQQHVRPVLTLYAELSFLPRDAMLSAVYTVVVCLCACVCLSVCVCLTHSGIAMATNFETKSPNDLNPYFAIGGGVFYVPPRRTFYPVALKPHVIVTKAFVTFPEYMWANKC